MKLLQTEIDVVPGRKAMKQPLPEGFVGTGVGVLRITNTTPRQNSYAIRLKCDQPYWQDSWYTLSALPPSGGQENAPPAGKPDQPGPRNQSLTIFVKDGGSRDVLLTFFVPEKSECRAGVYKATIVVETRVVSTDPAAAKKERTTEIPVTVIVRPFYRWSIALTPEERRVGILRRRAEFELAITNQGNDWLYCDLKPPRPQQVLIDAFTDRIAIPPPEGEVESVRTVPLRVISRIKTIRGPKTPAAVPLTVARANAPSVPPLPEEALLGPSSANLGATVLAAESGEANVPEVPSQVVYCPPIPNTFTGFMEALVRNAKGLVMMVIGAFVALQIAFFAYEMYFRHITEVRVTRSSVTLGESFRIQGKHLIGSQILLFDPATKAQIGEPILPKADPKGAANNYVVVSINDPELDNRKVIVGAQRLGRLTFLNRFLPVVKATTPVLIGEEKVKTGPPSGSVTANVAPGQPLTIGGVNFGTQPGKVLIDGNGAKVLKWSNETIEVQVPESKELGDIFSVAAFTADGASIPITPATVTVKLPGESDRGPESEPVIGPDGELYPPGTDVGAVVKPPPDVSPPVRNTGALPASYNLLLSDQRAEYAKAVSETRGSRDAGSLAVQAYALAALNRSDEARTAVRKALEAVGDRQQGEDLALCLLALSKVVENVNPTAAEQGYVQADAQVDEAAPGFVFKDLVIARYKASTRSNFEAKTILQDALRKNPSSQERSAIQALLRKVGG